MNNPLRKIFGGGFFSKGSDSVLGIDIGSSSIKIVQLKRKKGVAVLETYGEIALGPYAGLEIGQATNLQPSKIAEALRDLLKESNTTTSNSGMSIPFTSSLVSLIKMPSLPDKRLAKMIPIEARKYIPVPITEVILDWFVMPKDENNFISPEANEEAGDRDAEKADKNKIDVLLVAIHNETLSRYGEVVKSAGLNNSFFEIEIFSTIRAVLEASLTTTVIMDMGAGATKLYIVELGIVKSSHVINSGSQDITRTLSQSLGISITKAEEIKRDIGLNKQAQMQNATEAMLIVLGRIFGEVNRAFLQYEKKYNKNIGQTILTGGGAALKGLLSIAENNLKTSVVLGDPFSKTQSPAFLEDVLKEVGPEFAVAIGLALRKLQEFE
jgi:type IV pilus assembly protein PilM